MTTEQTTDPGTERNERAAGTAGPSATEAANGAGAARPEPLTTERLLELVAEPEVSTEATVTARAEVAQFRHAARRGADRPVVAALRQALAAADGAASGERVPSTSGPRGGGAAEGAEGEDPAAGMSGAPWRAWVAGTAAATAAARPPRWVAVCAAVDALDDARDTDTGEATDAAPGGDRVVEATALGYRVAELVAEALGTGHTDAGWDIGCTAGAIGACAAAGRLLALDSAALRHVFGITATQAAGLAAAERTDAGAVALGKAAANAVEAALLARHGFTSSAQPLEGRRGLLALMSGPSLAGGERAGSQGIGNGEGNG